MKSIKFSIPILLIHISLLISSELPLKIETNIQPINFWNYINTYVKNEVTTTFLEESKLIVELNKCESIGLSKKSQVFLDFPTVNGNLKSFQVYHSPVMPNRLKRKFPNIKTYTGIGLENPNERISITVSHLGIKAMIIGDKNKIFIDPIENSTGLYRVSYNEMNVSDVNQNLGCGDNDVILRYQDQNDRNNRNNFPACVGEDQPCYSIGDTLVTFRFAGIVTTEANNQISDGTVDGGLAWLNAMVNQVNLLWVRELSFRLELIENNDLLIYTNSNPTPSDFTYYDMYTELPLVLDHITDVIGPGGYNTPEAFLLWEYGAVFNTGYGGGLAYVPGSTSANIPYYDIFNHEIGHNLGSSHNCSTENGWKSTIGGTIMCWRGTTLPESGGDQYSSHTIDIAIKYQQERFGGSNYDYQRGWTRVPTNNNPPEVIVPESGFSIPKETPFVLNGYATDENSENLSYSWEQNDVSEISFESPEFPDNSGPLFCSVDPSIGGHKRYFPSMTTLLQNHYDTPLSPNDDYIIEKLPFDSRELNMRLLVRDNDLYSGGFSYNNVEFSVDDNSGPFRVTSQTLPLTWETGTSQLIIWDVANTDNPDGVNCQSVDIILSIDGGENFDIILEEATPNDGSESIFVPNLPSNNISRLMVKSSDNIFFDVNNSFFSINNSALPVLGIDTTEIALELTTDSIFTIEREITNNGEIGSVLTYDIVIDYESNGNGFLTFDGYDDNVDLGSNLLSGSGNFSISLWMKSTGYDQVIIQQRNGGFNGEYQLRIDTGGNLNFWTYRDGYQWNVTTPETFNDGNWHHVVIVQDIELDGGRIYVDGLERANNSDGLVNLDGSIHTYLGADMRDNQEYLNGSIDEVAIFNNVLSQSSIVALFNSGFGFNLTYDHGGYDGSDYLVAFYPMELMSGSILQDHSANHNNGTIYGAGWTGDLMPIGEWLFMDNNFNQLESGQTDLLTININTNDLTINNSYDSKIIILSNDITKEISVNIDITDHLIVQNSKQPKNFQLMGAYPNPFNPVTQIKYNLPEDSFVSIKIYDVMGRNIKTLLNEQKMGGYHTIRWDATNNFGEAVPAGIYFYTIDAGSFTNTKKMIFLK